MHDVVTVTVADHPSKRRERSALPGAFVIALALEALLLFSFVTWFTQPVMKEGTPGAPIEISIVDAPEDVQAVPEDPPPPDEPPPPEEPPPPPPPPDVPATTVEPPKPTPKPVHKPARPAAAPSAGAPPSFQGAVLRAVQAALVYPSAAKAQGQHGRARVAFDYIDGHVSGVRIAQSSGSSILDQGALATVRNASYPPPPGDLAHRTMHFIVNVEFKTSQ